MRRGEEADRSNEEWGEEKWVRRTKGTLMATARERWDEGQSRALKGIQRIYRTFLHPLRVCDKRARGSARARVHAECEERLTVRSEDVNPPSDHGDRWKLGSHGAGEADSRVRGASADLERCNGGEQANALDKQNLSLDARRHEIGGSLRATGYISGSATFWDMHKRDERGRDSPPVARTSSSAPCLGRSPSCAPSTGSGEAFRSRPILQKYRRNCQHVCEPYVNETGGRGRGEPTTKLQR